MSTHEHEKLNLAEILSGYSKKSRPLDPTPSAPEAPAAAAPASADSGLPSRIELNRLKAILICTAEAGEECLGAEGIAFVELDALSDVKVHVSGAGGPVVLEMHAREGTP